MGDIASTLASRYPTEFELENDRKINIRLMVPADVEAVLTFAKCLDLNDLLYLRVNITERSAVERWAHYIEAGRTYTVLALDEKRVVGEASLLHSTASWTRHIGEIRMQVIPQARRNGLARALAQEIECNGSFGCHIVITVKKGEGCSVRIVRNMTFFDAKYFLSGFTVVG